MSPLLVFILVVSICQFAQLHYKAGKRIKALEKEVEDLNRSFSEYIDTSLIMAEVLNKVVDKVHDQEVNQISEHFKSIVKKFKESNDGNA